MDEIPKIFFIGCGLGSLGRSSRNAPPFPAGAVLPVPGQAQITEDKGNGDSIVNSASWPKFIALQFFVAFRPPPTQHSPDRNPTQSTKGCRNCGKNIQRFWSVVRGDVTGPRVPTKTLSGTEVQPFSQGSHRGRSHTFLRY